jgi:AcrR family transcriptional regulator
MASHGRHPPGETVGDDDREVLNSTDRIVRLLGDEMGPDVADMYARSRALQDRWARMRHPGEGLRERKKRLTRQQISDVATTLFIARGFEHVTVAQIAEIVGVSEKTIYNYFPAKESLVFDEADDASARLATALRERGPLESPTSAMLRALADDANQLKELPEESHRMMLLFAEMVASTPALRAAWLELQDRLTEVARAELARHADVDPLEPEPAIAARAIVGLTDVYYRSIIRHIEAGLHSHELSEAVAADLERAARLLDTGLWSFSLLTQGSRTRAQLREAALAAEAARKQVMDALKQARSTWRELRAQTQEQPRQQRAQAKRAAKAHVAAVREEAKQRSQR